MPADTWQYDSTGYHGTHLHALWAILAQGLRPSGPQVPGSRFFEVKSTDGSTKAVAGIYLFKADRCQKCLFYAPAVSVKTCASFPPSAGGLCKGSFLLVRLWIFGRYCATSPWSFLGEKDLGRGVGPKAPHPS